MHMTLYNNYTLQTWTQRLFKEPWTYHPRLNSACAQARSTFCFCLCFFTVVWVGHAVLTYGAKKRAGLFKLNGIKHFIVLFIYFTEKPLLLIFKADRSNLFFNNGIATYSLLAAAGSTLGPSPSHDKLQMCFFSLPLFVLLCENAMLPCHSDISAIGLTFVVMSMGCFMNNSLP